MIRLFMIAISAAVILVSLTAYVASRTFPDVWWIEISSHFVPQQVLATFLAAICLALLTLRGRTRIWVVIAVALSIASIVIVDRVSAYNSLLRLSVLPLGQDGLRIVSFNVLTSNPEKAKVLRWLKSTVDPRQTTIVFLTEVDAEWLREMRELKSLLPFGFEHPRSDNYGIAVYSSAPLSDARAVTSSGGGVPMLRANIRGARGWVRLIGAHTKAPVSNHNLRLRDSHLSDIRAIVDESPEPAIVMGDLNCSRWSPSFRRLDVGRSELINPFPGIFRPSTWRPFRVGVTTPIDHVLFTTDFGLSDAWVEDADLGSDHQPVVVTLRWNQPGATP